MWHGRFWIFLGEVRSNVNFFFLHVSLATAVALRLLAAAAAVPHVHARDQLADGRDQIPDTLLHRTGSIALIYDWPLRCDIKQALPH